MAYSPGYSIDIRPNGDTVRGAFEKYNAEVVKIYGILNTLDDKDITAAELETLKTGPIAGSRVTGTISGYVDISHVTGDIPASSVSGSLTKATISTGSVTGLEAYVQELISQSGSSTDKGDGITTSSLSGNGYAKFNNGLIIQR